MLELAGNAHSSVLETKAAMSLLVGAIDLSRRCMVFIVVKFIQIQLEHPLQRPNCFESRWSTEPLLRLVVTHACQSKLHMPIGSFRSSSRKVKDQRRPQGGGLYVISRDQHTCEKRIVDPTAIQSFRRLRQRRSLLSKMNPPN